MTQKEYLNELYFYMKKYLVYGLDNADHTNINKLMNKLNNTNYIIDSLKKNLVEEGYVNE